MRESMGNTALEEFDREIEKSSFSPRNGGCNE